MGTRDRTADAAQAQAAGADLAPLGHTRPLILGLAREGTSLARFLADRGARVTVTDARLPQGLTDRLAALDGRSVRLVLGGDHPELIDEADVLFVSPGVPETNPVYHAAVESGLPVRSMTTLFFEICPGPIVGVTGSSGKTTTTGLIGHILGAAGRDVVVGGNIGDPMLDLLPRIGRDTVVVLELSSFQLDLLRRSPHLAVVTNITPNHLDRHGTMERYIAAKRRIIEGQRPEDHAVLNALDEEVMRFAGCTPATVRTFGPLDRVCQGAAWRETDAGLVRSGAFQPVLPLTEIPLIGRHNVENVLAALAACDILGVDEAVMAGAVQTFRPAPHRLQTVGEHDGVTYIDDSIATSPARAAVALRSLDAPVILIAGGRDKHLPWTEFAELAVQKARALILIGEATPLIEEAVHRQIALDGTGRLHPDLLIRCPTLSDAVSEASRLANPGDVVLLSPGCASYDMFIDFEERGRVFARAVEALRAA